MQQTEADARIELVKEYIIALARYESSGAAVRLGRGNTADRVADGELAKRWVTARRVVQSREEICQRKLPEERAHCRRFVDELAEHLNVDVDVLEVVLIEVHGLHDDDESALPTDQGELWDITKVAKKLDISVASVRRLVGDNILPRPLRLRAMVRWPKATIERWLKQIAK